MQNSKNFREKSLYIKLKQHYQMKTKTGLLGIGLDTYWGQFEVSVVAIKNDYGLSFRIRYHETDLNLVIINRLQVE